MPKSRNENQPKNKQQNTIQLISRKLSRKRNSRKSKDSSQPSYNLDTRIKTHFIKNPKTIKKNTEFPQETKRQTLKKSKRQRKAHIDIKLPDEAREIAVLEVLW